MVSMVTRGSKGSMLRVQGLRRSRVSVVSGFTVIARRNDEATKGFRGFKSLKGFNATRSRPSAFKSFSCFRFHCHCEEERRSNKWFQGFQMVSKGLKRLKTSSLNPFSREKGLVNELI